MRRGYRIVKHVVDISLRIYEPNECRKSRYPRGWSKIALKIKRLAKWQCEECGKRVKKSKLHAHHIIRNKGDCRYENLVALCNVCHVSIEVKGLSTGQLGLRYIEPPEWLRKRWKLTNLPLQNTTQPPFQSFDYGLIVSHSSGSNIVSVPLAPVGKCVPDYEQKTFL